MKIAYYPFSHKTNKYIEISQKCIKSIGHQIVDFKDVKFINAQRVDAVILNWYEAVNGGGLLKTLIRTALRVWKISLLKVHGIKIIYTFHNRDLHDTVNRKTACIVRWFTKYIMRKSDRIIILSRNSIIHLKTYICDEDIANKAFYIPHPNYIGAYCNKNNDIKPSANTSFTLLFVGQVRHYKNIEVLIETAHRLKMLTPPHSLLFIIAGKPESKAYEEELKAKTADLTNVQLDLRFIDDDTIETIISNSDIVVLPYDIQSSMNSGTVILAFSNGRTVICPKIATLMDFDESLFYSYTYDSDEEHKDKLYECILCAYNDWLHNRTLFNEKGRILYETVKENNSSDKIAEYYCQLFAFK